MVSVRLRTSVIVVGDVRVTKNCRKAATAVVIVTVMDVVRRAVVDRVLAIASAIPVGVANDAMCVNVVATEETMLVTEERLIEIPNMRDIALAMVAVEVRLMKSVSVRLMASVMLVREVMRRSCVTSLEIVPETEAEERSEANWMSVRETVELTRTEDRRPMN
jgi:hypothetical protein